MSKRQHSHISFTPARSILTLLSEHCDALQAVLEQMSVIIHQALRGVNKYFHIYVNQYVKRLGGVLFLSWRFDAQPNYDESLVPPVPVSVFYCSYFLNVVRPVGLKCFTHKKQTKIILRDPKSGRSRTIYVDAECQELSLRTKGNQWNNDSIQFDYNQWDCDFTLCYEKQFRENRDAIVARLESSLRGTARAEFYALGDIFEVENGRDLWAATAEPGAWPQQFIVYDALGRRKGVWHQNTCTLIPDST